MLRIATAVTLGLCSSLAGAQAPPPQAYTVTARGSVAGVERTLTIVRDGARERVEAKLGPYVMTTLYDFGAGRVYWIGWSGAGTCSSGRYLSARAPILEDPVTAAGDDVVRLAEGRTRKAGGSGTVAGMAARIEAFVGGKRPAGPDRDEPWPTRVWLAEQGGTLLKLEGEGTGGKRVTLLEVTQLAFGKPQGGPLEPPATCTATNTDMDDSGMMRGSATASVTAEAGGSVDLATGATSGSATVVETQAAKPRPPGALAKIEGLSLTVTPQPFDGPCGTRLEVTATLSTDGPATVSYWFRANVGGLRYPKGENGKVTLDGAGSMTLVREVRLPKSLKGTMRFQAMVEGTKGHNGPLKASDQVPFDVTCR